MLKIWCSLVKGLQSCQLSNFESDWTPGVLEPRLNALAHTSAGMAEAADFFLRTLTLTASNFAALWPLHLKFLEVKDLNLSLKFFKFQGAGSILRVGFAWSKWPHFQRVYLVTVCKQSLMAVDKIYIFGTIIVSGFTRFMLFFLKNVASKFTIVIS